MNRDRARIILASQASWTELEIEVSRVVAATLRNNGALVEAARARAHEMLDHHLDLKIEGVAAIRHDIEKQIEDI